jgi:hypothetical protein
VPYREVNMFDVKEVLRRRLAGVPIKRIARELRLDPKTVRRYVRAAELGKSSGTADGRGEPSETPLFEGTGSPHPTRPQPSPELPGRVTDDLVAAAVAPRGEVGRPRGDGWARCEEHRDFLERKLEERHMGRRLRLTKIRKLLQRERGVDVPYPTLHRFVVAELGFGRGKTTTPVADGKLGEEVQLDTGWVGELMPDEQGKRRRFRAWIFTPVCSRYRFVYPCFEESTETAIEACEAAWRFYGGIFTAIIPDNTKAIVNTPDPLEPVFTRAFLEYSQARDFFIDPTRVYSPKDKARVERSVQDVRGDCFAGERIVEIEGARERGLSWSRDDYGLRPHTTTGRRPREHFETDEKPLLKPAPTDRYEVPKWSTPKVHRDQHAQVARSLYSLPTRFVGKTLHARADLRTVRFYEGACLVKAHPRVPPRRRSTDPSDFPVERTVYALRDVESLKRWAREHGDAVGDFAVKLLDSPLPWTLRLAKRYGSERVNTTCLLALEAGLANVKRLERMIQLGEPKPDSKPCASIIPLAKYLRASSEYSIPGVVRTTNNEP